VALRMSKSHNYSTPSAGEPVPEQRWHIERPEEILSELLALDFSQGPFSLDAAFGDAASIESQIADATATTPLPATLPLFATGIGGLGLLGWRRKRKTQAVAQCAT
jgi:hypothetical protein